MHSTRRATAQKKYLKYPRSYIDRNDMNEKGHFHIDELLLRLAAVHIILIRSEIHEQGRFQWRKRGIHV